MTTSPERVTFDADSFWVELNDGRTIGVPLAWFPRLLEATREQLEDYELSPRGIHWEALDEDISVAGLLAGRGDRTRRRSAAPLSSPATERA
ncbi:DUF2442 domain-containing protein [Kushneria aurantia]|uniref:DUF2442 domain-containing protein n=1 Tax=Kushneria aurantia TaxID=504092 RepID=A0ABV6G5B7_9GAMM|nr:DUF2442 domain-containing protein [Kushneria aurantia]